MPKAISVASIQTFLAVVESHTATWPFRWFRGEPHVHTALLPRLYRTPATAQRENELLQSFRMRAPTYWPGSCPDREKTDQWLFLAQHVGLPTRLLDWTESPLVALFFALREAEPTVWMINPMRLNQRAVNAKRPPSQFPLTWTGSVNAAFLCVRHAWELRKTRRTPRRPVAIRPTNIHPRMSAQSSCFTIHGTSMRSLREQVPELLTQIVVDPNERAQFSADLRLLGVNPSTIKPDLDGLAEDLRDLY